MYQSIDFLVKYRYWFIAIIDAGIVCRGLIILFQAQMDGQSPWTKELRNLIIAAIILNCLTGFIDFARRFY